MIPIFISNSVMAQDRPAQAFGKLSCPEKRWVIFHPFVARRAFHAALVARQKSVELEKSDLLDKDADGGQVDAFRHAFWMALMTQKICPAKAIRLGKAHEKGNYRSFRKHQLEESSLPDSMSSVMDLFNNQVGAATGCQNKQLSEPELMSLIVAKIKAGELRKLRKDFLGKPLDCSGTQIESAQYRGKWSIPKCLVPSDFPAPDRR